MNVSIQANVAAAVRSIRQYGEAKQKAVIAETRRAGLNIEGGWKRGSRVRSNRLRSSLRRREHDGGMVVDVFTEVVYAPHLEYGTGLYGPKHAKYEIRPKNKKALAWPLSFAGGGRTAYLNKNTGRIGFSVKAENRQFQFARSVMHPGIKGDHAANNALEAEKPKYIARLVTALGKV